MGLLERCRPVDDVSILLLAEPTAQLGTIPKPATLAVANNESTECRPATTLRLAADDKLLREAALKFDPGSAALASLVAGQRPLRYHTLQVLAAGFV